MTDPTPEPARRALIVGATGAIGEALVRQLVGQGWSLTLVCRNEAKAKAAFENLGPGWELALCDLLDGEQVERVGAELARIPFDAAIINAGVVEPKPTVLTTAALLEENYRANVIGPMSLVRPVLAEMAKAQRGRLVANVSTGALLPLTNYGAYSGSKAALRAHLLALRRELHPHVPVTGVYLAGVETNQLAIENASPYGSPLNYISTPQHPEDAAKALVKAATMRRPPAELYRPWFDGAAARALTLSPNLSPPLVRIAEAFGRWRQTRRSRSAPS